MAQPLLRVADSEAQFNFDQITKLLIDTGGRSIGVRWGSGTFTYTAGVNSAIVTVTHGLGKTPVAIFLQTDTGEAMTRTLNVGATTFDAQGIRAGVTTASYTFYWFAIA